MKKEKIKNSSKEDSETETKQENDFKDSLSIRDTGLLDDIELEDSDIEEETILSFKNTKTYTQPNSKYILYSILSNTFKDSFNLTIQWTLYKAKDAMSFKKTIIQFVVCEKYYFLTNLESISNNSQASCSESTLLQRPGFKKLLESCYERENILSDIFSDLYDGQVWKTFKNNQKKLFFQKFLHKTNIGFAININWFKVTKHTIYSIAGIYLTILNLPCYLRYKKENTIFISLIPGPKKPPTEKINLYLDLLVDELKQLWAGQSFATIKYPAGRMYYRALILVSCDTLARNKICGFSSHSSKHAYFKCKKIFKTNNTSDQSNIDNYSLQNIKEHKIIARNGNILYLVSINSCLINMVFDTCKMIKIWTIETELISKNQLINIQNIVNNSLPPASIERIPYKIASSFLGFISDQWKTWTLIYSTMALRDI
ncbi:9119_t:CDS:2 [Dentiscutata erythropus]|uniref:9119_t:CDS:1 n=1 Tax=Dentiscutata erythropus TaxID=1348616 RepID=A0A9N9HAW9_9GLOM|nr:9119_t:CDS:2 [Dentiscutata erythropus]